MPERPPPSGPRIPVAEVLAWSMIVLVALGMVGSALRRPGTNTDLIFYAAVVHQWDGLDTEAIHEASLADARAYLSAEDYARITTENDYMRTVTADPEALVQQIPFYSVKVVFPALMVGLRELGVPLGFAQLLISLVAYTALSLLTFAWLRRHIARWPAVVIGALIIISSPWSDLVRWESPDALGALLGIGGLYLILELRRVHLGFAALVLTILARPNAVVMLLAVAACLVLLDRSHALRISWARAGLWSAAGIALALALTTWSGYYGLGTLFYHAIVDYLPYPAAGPPALPLSEVLRIYAFKAANIWVTEIPLFTLLGLLAARARLTTLRLVRTDAYVMVLIALFVTVVIGFATYPKETGRIQAMPFLATAIVLAISVGAWREERRPAG